MNDVASAVSRTFASPPLDPANGQSLAGRSRFHSESSQAKLSRLGRVVTLVFWKEGTLPTLGEYRFESRADQSGEALAP